MRIHEFGDKRNPVLLLLPGTACFWKANFGQVINLLAKDFFVAVVAYTGFDKLDTESYCSVTEETQKIEEYVNGHYGGSIHAAYGSSLGGSFVAHLVHRKKIHLKYGIIGSSDFDQMNAFNATILTSLFVKLTYNFIHNGHYKTKFMQARFAQQMEDHNPYNKAFVSLVGATNYDLSFISKESLHNQFKSDLVTKLPTQIDNKEASVHIFYAKKTGDKYLKRYKKYFKNPVIHSFNLRHEELLGVYPKEWCVLIKEICLPNEKT